jgi:hypothetical protein
MYFAENSSKSNQYVPCSGCHLGNIACKQACSCQTVPTEPHCILLCRVTLGNICALSATTRRPSFFVDSLHRFASVVCKKESGKLAQTNTGPEAEAGGRRYDSVLGESIPLGGTELNYREVIVYNRHLAYPGLAFGLSSLFLLTLRTEYVVFYHRCAK